MKVTAQGLVHTRPRHPAERPARLAFNMNTAESSAQNPRLNMWARLTETHGVFVISLAVAPKLLFQNLPFSLEQNSQPNPGPLRTRLNSYRASPLSNTLCHSAAGCQTTKANMWALDQAPGGCSTASRTSNPPVA